MNLHYRLADIPDGPPMRGRSSYLRFGSIVHFTDVLRRPALLAAVFHPIKDEIFCRLGRIASGAGLGLFVQNIENSRVPKL